MKPFPATCRLLSPMPFGYLEMKPPRAIVEPTIFSPRDEAELYKFRKSRWKSWEAEFFVRVQVAQNLYRRIAIRYRTQRPSPEPSISTRRVPTFTIQRARHPIEHYWNHVKLRLRVGLGRFIEEMRKMPLGYGTVEGTHDDFLTDYSQSDKVIPQWSWESLPRFLSDHQTYGMQTEAVCVGGLVLPTYAQRDEYGASCPSCCLPNSSTDVMFFAYSFTCETLLVKHVLLLFLDKV